jgi:pimeloyl-ACP methyl ester carboxylesterase
MLFQTRGYTAEALRSLYHDPEALTEAVIDSYHFPFQMTGGRSAYLSALRAMDDIREEELIGMMETIRARRLPTVLIWGENDASMPVGDAKSFAERLGARLVIIPRCGHLPFLELDDLRFERELLAPIEAWLRETRLVETASTP